MVASTETDGTDTAKRVADIHVTTTELADAPNLSAPLEVSGAEDSVIAIPLPTSLVRSGTADVGATLLTVVSGIPTGATLSDGANSFTATDANHSVDVSAWSLSDLKIGRASCRERV